MMNTKMTPGIRERKGSGLAHMLFFNLNTGTHTLFLDTQATLPFPYSQEKGLVLHRRPHEAVH
jgi:hypothetical protein